MRRKARRPRRRIRSARHYKPILAAYEKRLAGRVGLDQRSRAIARRNAERLFEACLRGLTPEALLALVGVWFHPAGYRRVIWDLQRLIEKRPRENRRSGRG